MNVKGVGGIFVKAKNPEKLYEWYESNLGLSRSDDGTIMVPTERLLPDYQIVNFVPCNHSYHSEKASCVLNFQVDNLSQMLSCLEKRGADVEDHLEEGDNGRFGWVYDPEGNKIELWEPRPYKAADLIRLPEAE